MKLRMIDPGRLNSATKYPSIPTYHEMGDGGRFIDEVQVPFDEGDELLVTEKIDGANGRIILFPDGAYVIGSRKELLYARGDLIHNAAQGIVDGVRDVAEQIAKTPNHFPDHVFVLYVEVYGGDVGKNARQYTSDRTIGFRLFDVVRFRREDLAHLVFDQDREQIARWRKNVGQPFVDEKALKGISSIFKVPAVPRITPLLHPLPTSVASTLEWLRLVLPNRSSRAMLEDDAGGRAEGVVVRTPDRSKIAKLRFQDYERTLKKG